MRVLGWFTFFILSFIPLESFSVKNDTALTRILRIPPDTSRISAFLKTGREMSSHSPKKSLRYADFALEESKRLNFKNGIAEALLLKGKCLDYFGSYKEALAINYKALEFGKGLKNPIYVARSFRQIGGMYQALGEYNQAIYYLKQSLMLSQNAMYKKGEASALSDLAVVYRCQSKYRLALDYIFKSLRLKSQINDTRNRPISYRHIGEIYAEMGDFERALDFQLKSLAICQKENDTWGIAVGYGNIGEIYIQINEFEKAQDYLKKSLFLKQKIGDKLSIANDLINLGIASSKSGRIIEALGYLKTAFDIQSFMGDIFGKSNTCSRLGEIYESISEIDSAINYYKLNLTIDKQLQNQESVVQDYMKISYCQIRKGDLKSALTYFNLARTQGNNHLTLLISRNLFELQSQLFEKQGKFKASLIAYKQFITLRDSAINQNKKVAVALKEAKYEFDKKALADSLKNNEAQKAKDLQIKFKDSELQKHKLKQNAMLAGIIVLFVLGWLLYSRYKAVSLQQVSERKLMLLEKEQALVEERTRIADEMHDDVGADLSNLLLKIRMNEHTQTQSAAQTVDLGGLKNSTNSIIHKIDEIIWSLNSHRDTLQELVNFIVKYYDTILKENNLCGKAEIQETLPSIALAAKQRRNIYLAVKEILNNALKHSQANSIQLGVGYENNILEIKVCDNGKGFDTEKSYQGNGLMTMRKRLDMMNGKLEITSTAKYGSEFLMQIPIV